MGRSSSSRGDHGSDGSGIEKCFERDTGTASAEMSESSDSDSSRDICSTASHSSKHYPKDVVEATDQSTYRKNTDETWDEFA